MRLGVIARAEDRGLGIQLWEVCRNMNPAKVLIVDMENLAGTFKRHDDRYAQWNPMVVPHHQMGDAAAVRAFLNGLDVVYFAETCYRWEFCDIARAMGVATVCHLNPEFFAHHHEPELPRPTQWWLPSVWLRHDPRLPQDARYMPMPCPLDRWPTPTRGYDGTRPLRLLHVGGHQAMADRNGTRSLLAALRYVTAAVHVTVTTQDRHLPSAQRLPANVAYATTAGRENYWDLYSGHDLLVQPRRYGGLCLPAIEAAGAGLALIMTDTVPQNLEYPGIFVNAREGAPILAKMEVPTVTADVQALAHSIDYLARQPAVLADMQLQSRTWAKDADWKQWRDVWRDALAALAF